MLLILEIDHTTFIKAKHLTDIVTVVMESLKGTILSRSTGHGIGVLALD